MPLKALIFDVDGTLAETEELHRACFNAAFAQAGLPWAWDPPLYGRLLQVTGGKERISRFIEDTATAPRLSQGDIAQLHRAKTALYTAAIAQGGVDLRPGVHRLINEAAQYGLTLAIATTTTPQNVDALLDATFGPGGRDRFAVIAAGDCVEAKKPAPDIYRLVLQRLDLDGADAIAVEDTPNGLQSAQGAGIGVLITRSLYGGEAGFETALAVVDHLGDPQLPCRVFRGDALPDRMVTVADLRRLTSPA